MSSDLLEQAMIDAAALKEAAMKNAENALIEKYSAEFNQTVQKLLEQEDMAAAGSDPAGTGATPPAGAAIPTEMPDLSAGAIDPMAGGLDTASQTDKAFSKVPGAFSSDDDELITINFDQIKATLNEMYDGGLNQDVTSDALAAGKGSKNDVVDEGSWEQEELELELEGGMGGSDDITGTSGVEELEEVELEQDVASAGADEMRRAADLKMQAAKEEAAGNAAKAKAASEEQKAREEAEKQASSLETTATASAGTMEEAIELTEEELQELAEELKVDIKVGNLSDGHMGSTETQKREQRTLELAAARDDKAAKQREEELAAMKDLMRENAELKSLNNEALEAIGSLKEQVERLNVLNAKLLYTNKALANVSLNERQKSNIVESLSKADSVLAAKTIYETVQNAVEGISKEKEAPQSLRETLNRAATPFVVKKSANNSVSDLMAERMKALAGIKKLS